MIKAKYYKRRNIWQIDPAEITPEAKRALASPRLTHKSGPIDKGDYYARHNLVRKLIDGKRITVLGTENK